MTQAQLNRQVARATGESHRAIGRLGFSPASHISTSATNGYAKGKGLT